MSVEGLVNSIMDARSAAESGRALLVGISGIDASGKGFIAGKVSRALKQSGFRIALINVDGWLNLPYVRFNDSDPGKHFYKHALRLDEMFARLIRPLKQNRSIDVTMDFAEETADSFRPHKYVFSDVDVVLLEGIFLFKRAFAELFDLRIWIECSFEAALERAIRRSQEGLTASETIAAYESTYFPAQRVHFAKDAPRSAADLIFTNQ